MAFPVMTIAIAVTFGIVLFVAAFLVFSLIVRNLADSRGSWRSLAAAYPGIDHEPDHSMVRQTIQIGVVTYKACVRVGIEPEGLWLGRSMVFPFMPRSTSIFIPWQEFRRVSPERFTGKGPTFFTLDCRRSAPFSSRKAYSRRCPTH